MFDLLATPDATVGLGETLSEFSIQFDWSGSTPPSFQFFEVYIQDPFDILAFGDTAPKSGAGSIDVPEPSSLLLVLASLYGLSVCRKRCKSNNG